MGRNMESESPTFEESFGRLQQAIEQLELGGLTLDAGLDLFEQSMELAAQCRLMLDRAELRLTRLVEEHAAVIEGGEPG
jgi:exodeoxyribonuclease VII small subunit